MRSGQIIPIYIPQYISSQTYAPARVLPRIFFYNGMVECETWYVADETNTGREVTRFPYFDNYNVVTGSFPTDGSKSLLFNNEATVYGALPSASLYSTYWDTYVGLLYSPTTRLINCSAIIPLADYFKMELNDICEWRGNYYHLRAINNYNLSNGECQLQLLGPIIPDILPDILPAIKCGFDFTFTTEADIVRDGLVMAYDWTSYVTGSVGSNSGSLIDRSGNGITGEWRGNLYTSSNALQFDGNSFIGFPTASTSMSFHPGWNWTIDTYGKMQYIDNTNTVSGYGWVSNIIAANIGKASLSTFTGSAPTAQQLPVWQWGVSAPTSGTGSNSNYHLRNWNQLASTLEYDATASLNTNRQWSYLGSGAPSISYITQSINSDYLVNQGGSGTNTSIFRTFVENDTLPFGGVGQLTFGGPQVVRSFGAPQFASYFISGSFPYILYYNRALTEAELEQNRCFFESGQPIPQGTSTTTTTTTTTSTTTTTTSTTSTTSTTTTTTTTAASGSATLYWSFSEVTGGNGIYDLYINSVSVETRNSTANGTYTVYVGDVITVGCNADQCTGGGSTYTNIVVTGEITDAACQNNGSIPSYLSPGYTVVSGDVGTNLYVDLQVSCDGGCI